MDYSILSEPKRRFNYRFNEYFVPTLISQYNGNHPMMKSAKNSTNENRANTTQ